MCWSLAASCTTLLTAQTAYQPLGNELPLAGVLPGDQAHPHAAISAAGGFVVWDDNATDGQGFGISAVALDTHLHAAQAPFRVNLVPTADQEHPRVALLKDGGAVFVWSGGAFGFQPGSDAVDSAIVEDAVGAGVGVGRGALNGNLLVEVQQL